jgi:hypothetical protein
VKPGIYEGVPMEEYLAMPACSASTLLTLLDRCPRAAWFDSWLNPKRPASSSTPAQSVGTLAHALLLEGSVEKMVVIDPNDHPNEKGGGFATGWTNKSVKAARDAALAAGKIPVFPQVARDVESMAAAARDYLRAVSGIEPAVHDLFQPGGGKSEVTIVWEEDGCFFRMRPDRLSLDMMLMGDVKTTAASAEPDRWGRTQLFGMGYYVAAAFYRRGLGRATGNQAEYVYLAQEQDPPHLCSLIGTDPAAKALGDAKVARGIARWKACMASGQWDGYPLRVAYPEAPMWEAAREEENHAIPYDISKMHQKLGGFDAEQERAA